MISIVIPAFNEEANLRDSVQTVVKAARESGDFPIEVIIVNDGSTDGTKRVSSELERQFPFVRTIHHQTNLGQGAGILDGIRTAKYDKLTMFPADNAVAPYTLRNLFKNRDKADYVLAYIVNSEYRGTVRVVLSKLFSQIYTTTFGLPIIYINSPCLWPLKLLRGIPLKSNRYSLFGEINAKLLRKEITFYEVDGYMHPGFQKSSAIRVKNFVEVVFCYFRLIFEIFFKNPGLYRKKARRVIPPGVFQ